MSTATEHTLETKGEDKTQGPHRGRRRAVPTSAGQGTGSSEPVGDSSQKQNNRRRWKQRPPPQQVKPGSASGVGSKGAEGRSGVQPNLSGASGSSRPPHRLPIRSRDTDGAINPTSNNTTVGSESTESQKLKGPYRSGRRGAKFNSELSTDYKRPTTKSAGVDPAEKYRNPAPKKDDLTSTLIFDLSTPPYPDCLICFAAIHPAQPTWSCSPLIPISSATDDETTKDETRLRPETSRCCWTTFHLKCIRSWASKSVKDIVEAWKVRGENRPGEWRCPGCQSKRQVVPASYWCFCGSMPDPKPPRLATPHSCAGPCSRSRVCSHPCSLPCHPGPCPPCNVTTELPCYCEKQTLSFRCSNLAPSRAGVGANLSCGKPCGRRLACGNHPCENPCHDGPCAPCKVTEVAKCYCEKTERELGCGEGVAKTSSIIEDGFKRDWTGRFECEDTCNRLFDCGVHRCLKRCHPPSINPAPCPRSPSLVQHCPCGKHPLESSSTPYFPRNSFLTRTSCTDPIPTCESTCLKPLEGCSHSCAAKCHIGPCPPCYIVTVRPCRCGSTTKDIRCYEDQTRARGQQEEIICDRQCTALRACGKHQCNRVCCPLASLVGKGKGKKKATQLDLDGLGGYAGWHECDLVCGKMLSCGNHDCEERDHRGTCPPCLRSSFEEMICHCGHTILEPPLPCGTQISCRYPCARPPLPCGHPKIPHACHEDPIPCPPCPVLTEKVCACGKKTVGNIRCSQERVSCGTTCGKLLACGFHHCEKLCHGDACGSCHAVCGKSRKLCLPLSHPCTLPCHAPASCSETEPCRALVTVTCPCGRIRQEVPCGRSAMNPAGREGSLRLKCSDDCLMAKRNARLAEALGISSESRSASVTYNQELVNFAKADMKFCGLVEKTFADFISSEKKSQILPHMPESRRKFVHDLATIYRLDTQMVDQEPHRSVQLIRRIDSRLPNPLLSASSFTASSSTSSLGKLADLRAPVSQMARPAMGPARSQASTPNLPGSRGWTSVVAGSTPSHPSPVPSPTPWPSSQLGRRSGAATPSQSGQPTPIVAAVAGQPSRGAEDVPDNWEDDV